MDLNNCLVLPIKDTNTIPKENEHIYVKLKAFNLVGSNNNGNWVKAIFSNGNYNFLGYHIPQNYVNDYIYCWASENDFIESKHTQVCNEDARYTKAFGLEIPSIYKEDKLVVYRKTPYSIHFRVYSKENGIHTYMLHQGEEFVVSLYKRDNTTGKVTPIKRDCTMPILKYKTRSGKPISGRYIPYKFVDTQKFLWDLAYNDIFYNPEYSNSSYRLKNKISTLAKASTIISSLTSFLKETGYICESFI